MSLTGASLNRGASRQDYGTPPDLLRAVETRFGLLTADLACTPDNQVATTFEHFYHGSDEIPWPREGRLWLNPPFSNIDTWAEKCAAWQPLYGAKLLFLTPASVGSNWFAKHVHGRAMVLALSPRITFVGCKDPYPKDCILSVFGESPGFNLWRWK
jgi:hypothetical protein